ncbi:hypothetical protein L2E82_48961 [Cichorium intybus]|uniref:Uncharacterized protein n=1 Tax=Cichorium intybus TaxID=13427 RepID=A0ACB8YZD7_CICIN|nr:hypothetical protein L2E82_48961 [Cichorium intybus]
MRPLSLILQVYSHVLHVEFVAATDYANVAGLGSSSGCDGLFDVPIKSEDDNLGTTPAVDLALKLLD